MRQKIKCPHCRAIKHMYCRAEADISYESAHFLFVCENCDGAVTILAEAYRPKAEFRRVGDLKHSEFSFEQCGWHIVDSWPKPEFDRGIAPACAPNEVAEMLEHSHEAAERGGHELAMLGYQRALRLIQRIHSPSFIGNIDAWILSLIKAGALTGNMRNWARRAKIRGAIDGATAIDCENLAAFVHTMLEQLFALGSRMGKFGSHATVQGERVSAPT